MNNRAILFVTKSVAVAAIIGLAAWYQIDKDSLVESFGTFREFFRFHAW